MNNSNEKNFYKNWVSASAETRIWFALCKALEDCYETAKNDIEFCEKYHTEPHEKAVSEKIIACIDDYQQAVDNLF